jgi:hypothetical protein
MPLYDADSMNEAEMLMQISELRDQVERLQVQLDITVDNAVWLFDDQAPDDDFQQFVDESRRLAAGEVFDTRIWVARQEAHKRRKSKTHQ